MPMITIMEPLSWRQSHLNPGFRITPHAIGRGGGDGKCLRGGVAGQACEESQFDESGVIGVFPRRVVRERRRGRRVGRLAAARRFRANRLSDRHRARQQSWPSTGPRECVALPPLWAYFRANLPSDWRPAVLPGACAPRAARHTRGPETPPAPRPAASPRIQTGLFRHGASPFNSISGKAGALASGIHLVLATMP